ncbi:hypothetical protein CBS101457_001460 [Exobasidium rhododendri]|nr:hypothetical protein CBS101457_001460 [Exobasidium rhododendri]
MAPHYNIAIIGAGPGGLTLASLLHSSSKTSNVKVTIFERDASPSSRTDQGGTLDLHADTGLAAIHKCGLWQTFLKHARYEGEELYLVDKNATTIIHKGAGKVSEKGSPFDRPEIDRQVLKEILLDSIPPEIVEWDHRLKKVTENGMLRFDQKEELKGPFDLIIGADGAWSKVRERLSDVRPVYSGISGFELEIAKPSETCPQVNQMVGRGSFIGLSDCKFLGAQRMGNDSIKVRSWNVFQEGEAKKILEEHGKKGTLEAILQMYVDWAPEVTELFKQGDVDGLHSYTLYELPVGTRWDHKQGYTLIGDAASLMTPFSGEGVNKAMKDCLELAEWIEKCCSEHETITFDKAVESYENQMFPRAAKLQAETMWNKVTAFTPEAPITLLTGMLKDNTVESSSIFVQMLGTRPFVALLYSFLWTRIQIGWCVRTFWRRT